MYKVKREKITIGLELDLNLSITWPVCAFFLALTVIVNQLPRRLLVTKINSWFNPTALSV